MKEVRAISVFLGITMFMFGVLKFVNPIKGWYSVQIINSGMNQSSYWLGIISEIFVGIVFLTTILFSRYLSKKKFRILITAASAMLVVMMLTAIRVHLHPEVPAAVLPLKIKTPVIPGSILLLAVTDIILIRRAIPARKTRL